MLTYSCFPTKSLAVDKRSLNKDDGDRGGRGGMIVFPGASTKVQDLFTGSSGFSIFGR